jgi:cytosine deaminase
VGERVEWSGFTLVAVCWDTDGARPARTFRRVNGFTSITLEPMPPADSFLRVALDEARQGLREGGIPIGSVLVSGDRILGRGHNRREQAASVVLHAEMDALERAGRQPGRVYRGCTLYTTLSPCAMCSGAILLYGIPRVVVGENRTFMGEEELLRSRGVAVEVVNDPDCERLLAEFVREHPELWAEDIGR